MKPILIVGPPRTGTTLLGRLLADGDDVLSLSEPFHLASLFPPWALRLFFARLSRTFGLERVSLPRVCSPDRYFRFLQTMAHVNHLRYLVIKEVFHEIGLHPRWGNLTLLDGFASDHQPIIAIIRDPRDAAASTVNLLRRLFFGWHGRVIRLLWPTVPRFKDNDDIVRWSSQNWVHFVEWTRQRRLFVIRYEDLVANTEQTLRRVCDYTGLPFHERMLDHYRHWPKAFIGVGAPEVMFQAARPVHANSVGRGRKLTYEQHRTIRDICGDQAASLGYTIELPLECPAANEPHRFPTREPAPSLDSHVENEVSRSLA